MYIRGAYFVGKSTTANKLIDFFIVSPKNKVIFSRRKAEEGIFRFNTTMPGRYSFIFSNIKVFQLSLKDIIRIVKVTKISQLQFTHQRMMKPIVNKTN
jgi:hypothetical protein